MPIRPMTPTDRRAGFALCITSAVAFGALPIFGKVAFDHGANVVTLLFIRFAIASAVLWLIVLATKPALPPTRRLVLSGLLMGALGYGIQ